MIASRLLQVASDFVDDYKNMKVDTLLEGAASLCAARPQTTSPAFSQQSAQLRTAADQIIVGTRFNSYPQVYRDYLNNTRFASSLPARVAQFVKSGLTGDVATTISSNEFNVIAQAARSSVSEMQSLINTLGLMNVEKLNISEDSISVEFFLPRSAFDNTVSEYLKLNDRVNAIMLAFSEFCGSGDREPELIFTSTTDPITAFGISVGAAYGVVQLINGLLDIAKKSIDLYSSIRLLRDRGIASAAQMQSQTEALTKDDIEKLVETTFRILQSDVTVERRNELRNTIAIHAVILLPVIADGATISLSPESLAKLDRVKPELAIVEAPTLTQLQVENGLRTRELLAAVNLNGGRGLLRLEQRESERNADNDAPKTTPLK